MILNRLIVPCGNKIEFTLSHEEDGEKYKLKQDEQYYMLISHPKEPFENIEKALSESSHFSFSTSLANGEYVFEIGIISQSGERRVILPAVDERLRPLNQLLVLRRVTM